MMKRGLLSLVAGALAGLTSLSGMPWAHAQGADFPNRPVTLVIPFQAGVSADLLFRALAESASPHLGQPIIIDNKPGGSATLGPAQMAATAKPDGYTIAQIAVPLYRVPYMQKASFDPVKDFSYIILLGGYTLGAAVKADSPFKTWKDVVAYAKENPGKFTYATIGPATTNAIATELMSRHEGIKLTHIPTKGGGESIAAVLGGHMDMMVESPAWAPLVAAGQMRALFLLGNERSAKWPDVPSMKDLGFPFSFDSPFGLAGPKGMDPAIVKKIHDAFKKAYDDPKVLPLYEKFDFSRRYMNTADYNVFVPKMNADEKEALEKIGLAKKE
jgi:tripartite-type tricarboxylate transporter receptor subunit TctC